MISEEEITHLTHLCRIECSSEEKRMLADQLDKILEYVEQLKQINTQGVPPCLHVLSDASTHLREDKEGPCLAAEDFLNNAPARIGSLVKVPRILN